MLSEEKVKQVKKMLSGGLPEGEIKNQLKEEGYTEEEIKEIFKPKPYDMRSWLLVFGILVSLLGIYVFMKQSSFLLLILGILLLWQYHKHNLKHKQEEKKKLNQ